MVYRLCGNPIYIVTDDSIYNCTNNEHLIKNNDDCYVIELYGIVCTKPHEWFYNIAKYNVDLPYLFTNRISDIVIRKYGRVYNKSIGVLIQTREPIIFENDYAVVLDNPELAISKNGVIINTMTKEIINIGNNVNSVDYTYIYYKQRPCLVHRMLLQAWLWNPDPLEYYLVNHIDGNKFNNTLDNLEWSNNVNNTKHAVVNNLHYDNVRCKIKNKDTGIIYEFISITEMCKFIKIAYRTVTMLDNYKSGYTIHGYEIRTANDKRPWYYLTGKEETVPQWATVKLELIKDGLVDRIFYNRNDISRFLGAPNKTPIPALFKFIKNKNLPYTLVVTELIKSGPYQAYNKDSGNVYTSNSIRELHKLTKNSMSLIHTTIRYGKDDILHNGWAFRYKTNLPWPVDFRLNSNNSKPKPIIVKNIITGEYKAYDNILKASTDTNITRKTIRFRLKTGTPIKDLLFTYQ